MVYPHSPQHMHYAFTSPTPKILWINNKAFRIRTMFDAVEYFFLEFGEITILSLKGS